MNNRSGLHDGDLAQQRLLLETLLKEIQQEFPAFQILPKANSPLQVWINRLLKVITFGGQNEYLTRYHTVLGYTLYVPTSWADSTPIQRYLLLRHERIHLRQRRRYGMFVMTFLYLFVFAPVGFAYGRARIEWEAYEETLRATAEIYGAERIRVPQLRDYIVKQFTSAAYGWMWPFRRTVLRWYDDAVERIVREQHMGIESSDES